jgi:hypothetical protein
MVYPPFPFGTIAVSGWQHGGVRIDSPDAAPRARQDGSSPP